MILGSTRVQQATFLERLWVLWLNFELYSVQKCQHGNIIAVALNICDTVQLRWLNLGKFCAHLLMFYLLTYSDPQITLPSSILKISENIGPIMLPCPGEQIRIGKFLTKFCPGEHSLPWGFEGSRNSSPGPNAFPSHPLSPSYISKCSENFHRVIYAIWHVLYDTAYIANLREKNTRSLLWNYVWL